MSSRIKRNDDQDSSKEFAYRAKSAFAVILSLVILISAGWITTKWIGDKWYEFRTAEDYIGSGTEEVIVVIPKGASVSQIGSILQKEGVIKSTKAFLNAAGEVPNVNSIQAGKYKLRKEVPAETAIEMLLDPANIVRVKVTLPEGLTMAQQWVRIEKDTGIPQADLKAAVADPEAIGLPPEAEGVAEGFLFPDTYEVDETPTANEILIKQTTQFKAVAQEIHLADKAKENGVTPLQAVIIASLIEREVSRPEDRPLVASVIYNRLAIDMPLQLDSTVHYAVNNYDKVTTTDEQRATDSPYNTYVHKGLPPAPISNPGKSALQAAVNPAESEYLYFVTVNLDTRETKFAVTYEDHLKNQAEFQAWCQDNKGRC